MLLALFALAVGGCGRLGYDPVGSEVAGDGGVSVGVGAGVGDSGADAPSPSLPPRRPRGFAGGGFPSAPRQPRLP